MKKFVGFERGMGIGGWLTNYKRFNVLKDEWRMNLTIGDFEHFDSYITESDVEYIASLGMDHIRLGFDQIVMEEKPYVYRERTFACIDRFIGWCHKHGLNAVLNLHKAIGNYCDIHEEVGLMDDEELQNRFIALWEYFEKRYADEKDVVFELLNEVLDIDPKPWNDLAKRTVNAIRKLNMDRKIVIGSTCWNSAHRLKDLEVFDDENVIYTFHMYAPNEFTHQRGVLQAPELYYNRNMEYPGDIEKYRDYQRLVKGNNDPYPKYDRMDSRFIEDDLADAVDFIKRNPDKILWLGEFGTIRHAKIQHREAYMHDVIAFCKKNAIPYCVWNYLSTPNDGNRFSLVDDDNRKILSDNLAKIIRGDFEI